MHWEDILQDFDVVVSEQNGRQSKGLYIDGLLYYIDGLLYYIDERYKWKNVDQAQQTEQLVGIYRADINLKSYALRGDIRLMEKIYPKEYKNYKVILQFTGDIDKYKGTMSRELWDNVKEDHDKIQYVLIVDEEGNKDIAELVSVEELTDSEYNYKAVNVFIV